MQDTLEPTIFVIFGVTGDLAQHRLLPALYHLIRDNLLDQHTEIIGVSRRDLSTKEVLKNVELCVLEADGTCDPATLKVLNDHMRMVKLDPLNGNDYDSLRSTLDSIEETNGMCMNRVFYLSIPPQVYGPIVENLGIHKLHLGCQHHRAVSRLLVEKPFGYDLTSAQDLIASTSRYFGEEQLFRIDHYLAKESVQNILFFRKKNPIFADLWEFHYIKSIAISWSEKIGIEGRGEFYDRVGALRDVVQNHLLQIASLVTMDLPPSIKDSDTLHAAKQQLLSQIDPVDVNKHPVIRGQYDGYRAEVGAPNTATETFVSLTLSINSNRWWGVPITISAGKALKTKHTTVAIEFISPSMPGMTNMLTFRIQPNEGIDIELVVKRPGFDDRTEVVHMDFSYHGAFDEPEHPDAYERVLVDAVRGDHSLFTTSQEVLEAWRILQPVLEKWEQSSDDVRIYQPGSDGP